VSLLKPIIAPSILSADFANLEKDIRAAERGGADYFHIDVMDGHFVPNISYGPIMARTMKKITDVPLDAHLMITDPDKFIPEFVEAGVKVIVPHIEAPYDVYRTVQYICNLGVQAGIALNPGTPAELIEPLLDCIDLILVMSVCPGYGGQKFIPSALEKVRKIRKMVDELKPSIHVALDGGVTKDNITEIFNAGANFIVAGSAVFRAENIEQAVRDLKGAMVKK
jgi:ribulose-phosphate 3-epimerase